MPYPQPTGRGNSRLGQTVKDMIWSLLLVLAVVGAVLLVTWRSQPDAVRVVDITPAVTLASMQAPFTVQSPVLPDTWRATSARWEPTEKSAPDPVLFLGFVTPSGGYAQLSESASAGIGYTAEQTNYGVPVGSRTVAGVEYDAWQNGDRRSLVRIRDGVTTIVSGTTSWDELDQLAGSLAPVASTRARAVSSQP